MSPASSSFMMALLALIGVPVVAPALAWRLARQSAIRQRHIFRILAGGIGAVVGAFV
jgi:hypothetical protein